MLYPQNALLAGLFIVLAELMFASMGAAVKALGESQPTEMLVFFRNLLGAAVLLPWLAAQRTSLATRVAPLHLLRATAGLAAMYCFFYALARLPLADGMLLKMTAPLFIPLVAWAWLAESPPRLALAALPIGFAGVVLVLHPGGNFAPAALAGLGGGLFAAVAKVTVRRLSRSEPAVRTVFYFAILATAVSALPLPWSWRTPQPHEWWLLLATGVLGTLGQLLLTRGYSAAAMARVAPLTYFAVVFGASYGYIFWGERLDWRFVAGSVLIALAGIVAVGARARSTPAAAIASTET